MPGVIVADVAAEHRPHDGRDDDGDAVKRKGLPSLRRRESIGEDGLSDRRHAAAGKTTLKNAENQ